MYGLHRVSIRNPSILAISHGLWRFHTFFHTFFIKIFRSALLHSDTQLQKKGVGRYLRMFSNFGWVHNLWRRQTTINDAAKDYNTLSGQIPQAKKKFDQSTGIQIIFFWWLKIDFLQSFDFHQNLAFFVTLR